MKTVNQKVCFVAVVVVVVAVVAVVVVFFYEIIEYESRSKTVSI